MESGKRTLQLQWRTLVVLFVALVLLETVAHSDSDSEADASSSPSVEFFEKVLLTLNQRFHELDRDMNAMLIEDPVEDFLDMEDKPLLQRMEYLEENVTTSMELNGTEAALLLFEINKEHEAILNSITANDRKHNENIELRDERRDRITASIEHLISDLKDAVELQSELGIDNELDSTFTPAFKKMKINATTTTQVKEYLEAMSLMEDMAENPKEFMEKKILNAFKFALEGNPVNEQPSVDNEKYAELNEILVSKMVERDLDQIKPSNIIGIMLEKLADGKDSFESKLYWKYEAMAEKYMTFAKEVTVKKYNALVDKIQKLEVQVETQLKEYIDTTMEEKKRKLLEEHDEL